MGIPVLKMNAVQALINHLAVNDILRDKKPLHSKNIQLLLPND